MTETFMIKKAMFKSTNMMRLQKLQQNKQMIIQQDVVRYQYLKDHYQLILQLILVNKKVEMLIQEQFKKLDFMEC